LAKQLVVVELEASQTVVEEFVSRIQTTAAGLGIGVRIEAFALEGQSPSPDNSFFRALGDIDRIVDTAAADRAEYARSVRPGDSIVWWDDDLGFVESIVTRIDAGAAQLSFQVEGSERRVNEDDLYRPLNVHDARLWAVRPGDEIEWYCPTAAERSANDVRAPHCPDAGGSSCPGGLWHRGIVERVLHEGFEAPRFEVAGCTPALGEPLFQIRVPGPPR